MDAFENAAILQSEARQLLANGLETLLAQFGRVVPHGSYALGLMAWRDLDLYVVPGDEKLDVAGFFDLGSKISALLQPHRMHFRDERRGEDASLPKGLYWGVYLRGDSERAWKIDIWAVGSAELTSLLNYQRDLEPALNPAVRTAILRIKSAVWRHPEYRRRFTAKDIYDAVIVSGVRDVDSYVRYLESSKGLLINEVW